MILLRGCTTRWSRRMCAYLLQGLQKYNLLLNNHRQENVGSHHKKTPTSNSKGEAPKDGRRGKIEFRIKPCIHQRCLEDSNKTLCAPGPRDHTDCARPSFECLSVSCRDTGQQWPATGEGTLGAADLGHTAGGISPLGGGRH